MSVPLFRPGYDRPRWSLNNRSGLPTARSLARAPSRQATPCNSAMGSRQLPPHSNARRTRDGTPCPAFDVSHQSGITKEAGRARKQGFVHSGGTPNGAQTLPDLCQHDARGLPRRAHTRYSRTRTDRTRVTAPRHRVKKNRRSGSPKAPIVDAEPVDRHARNGEARDRQAPWVNAAALAEPGEARSILADNDGGAKYNAPDERR